MALGGQGLEIPSAQRFSKNEVTKKKLDQTFIFQVDWNTFFTAFRGNDLHLEFVFQDGRAGIINHKELVVFHSQSHMYQAALYISYPGFNLD